MRGGWDKNGGSDDSGESAGGAGRAGDRSGETNWAQHRVASSEGRRGRGGELHHVEGRSGGANERDSVTGAKKRGGEGGCFATRGRARDVCGDGERVWAARHSGEQRWDVFRGEIRRADRRPVGPHHERES